MKLLVIEDEQKTASFLKRGFSEAGFVVDVAPDGPEAMRLIQAGPYDLMVLDLMLPGVDGLRVLTWMRASEVRSPGPDPDREGRGGRPRHRVSSWVPTTTW